MKDTVPASAKNQQCQSTACAKTDNQIYTAIEISVQQVHQMPQPWRVRSQNSGVPADLRKDSAAVDAPLSISASAVQGTQIY
ncbi:MAG: hypothetical protein CBE00_13570 [Planctomycetaceae bacterium TMED240]|nr:hypothetical protein [Rhodopirellula sp.]OUX03917.1 MAG: hypothetical protein CBE00_13570 [Planctomycetaceae bacterium TMED240]